MEEIIDLDLTEPREVYPSSLTLHTSPVRGCGRRQTGQSHVTLLCILLMAASQRFVEEC